MCVQLADKEKAKGDGGGPDSVEVAGGEQHKGKEEPKEEVINREGARNRDQRRGRGGNRGRQGQGARQEGEKGRKGQQQGRGQAKGEKQKGIGRGQERSERGRKGRQGSVDEEVLLHVRLSSLSFSLFQCHFCLFFSRALSFSYSTHPSIHWSACLSILSSFYASILLLTQEATPFRLLSQTFSTPLPYMPKL
jgi:hypothetical protein